MNRTSKKCIKIFKELLDSDDELPDTYTETSKVPAYLNDNRFEDIKFSWIKNKNFTYSKYSNSESNGTLSEDTKKNNYVSRYPRLKKGILSKYDIFCLKCVENNITDTTLLWFVNFLIYKDMQSHYKFLKSCLVNDFGDINEHAQTDWQDFNQGRKCTYRIIVT